MGDKLDLNFEVERLLRWKGELKGVYVVLLPHDKKIDILARGVIDGWYGEEIIQRAILKDYYQEVRDRVSFILSK